MESSRSCNIADAEELGACPLLCVSRASSCLGWSWGTSWLCSRCRRCFCNSCSLCAHPGQLSTSCGRMSSLSSAESSCTGCRRASREVPSMMWGPLPSLSSIAVGRPLPMPCPPPRRAALCKCFSIRVKCALPSDNGSPQASGWQVVRTERCAEAHAAASKVSAAFESPPPAATSSAERPNELQACKSALAATKTSTISVRPSFAAKIKGVAMSSPGSASSGSNLASKAALLSNRSRAQDASRQSMMGVLPNTSLRLTSARHCKSAWTAC
mmetsp:Transcript_55403/g.161750  ORF Transcript_55403/g.161750 Transcript_55403/m.161750 type:complete len:270 (+) Transcript_55403:598-1407(+)